MLRAARDCKTDRVRSISSFLCSSVVVIFCCHALPPEHDPKIKPVINTIQLSLNPFMKLALWHRDFIVKTALRCRPLLLYIITSFVRFNKLIAWKYSSFDELCNPLFSYFRSNLNGYFDFKELKPAKVKGKKEPVRIFLNKTRLNC